MESKYVLHNSISSEELNRTCVNQKTCAHVQAQDISHDIADPHQKDQRYNHRSQQFGRSLHLAMACINGADRLQRSKIDKANSIHQDFTETTPHQRTKKELSSDLHRVSAEIDSNRAELLDLMVKSKNTNDCRRCR